jgi:hypothetical protein
MVNGVLRSQRIGWTARGHDGSFPQETTMTTKTEIIRAVMLLLEPSNFSFITGPTKDRFRGV